MSWKYVLPFGIGVVLAASPPVRAVGPSVDLTAAHLVEAGLHLPSCMPTVPHIMEYEDKLAIHQELKVEWDSLPGRTGSILKEKLVGVPLAPNFTLLQRKQSVRGGAGKSPLWVSDDCLIVAAVTAQKEIRGLKIEGDPRESHAEDMRPGKKPQRLDFVEPKGTLFIALPDEPQIDRLLFFKPAKGGSDGGWKLQQVGALVLSKSGK